MITQIRKSAFIVLALASLAITSVAQQGTYRLSDRQVSDLLRRVENQSLIFQRSLDAALDRSRFDSTRRENEINQYVREFTAATDRLRDRFNQRRAVSNDVSEVLNRAASIDDFMRRERLDTRAQSDWLALRRELDQLARAWNVTWNWNERGAYSPGSSGNFGSINNRLTGTWRLNVSRSDDPRTVVDRATRTGQSEDRTRIQDNLLRRLEAPDALAIERRSQSITMISTRAPQVTFEADGRENVETLRNGRERRTTTTLMGDRLVVRTTGDRGSDYEVTFEPFDGGRSLRVTRSLYNDRLNRTIVARSIYDRTSDVARFDIYNSATDVPTSNTRSTRRGNFVIPDGTTVLATLNNDLRTREAQEGDLFSLTVREPRQYNGAVIEGRIVSAERSGRVAGRAGFLLEFERIKMRDGRTYEFAGTMETVRQANGEVVRVDTEGSVEEDKSQTERTIGRSAIGGAIGAIIGAIAGGGKGAAIGAVVGAGAGAGSVYVQGRDDLELTRGAEFTIRASAPR